MKSFTDDLKSACSFSKRCGLFSNASIVMGQLALRTASHPTAELFWAMLITVEDNLKQHVCSDLGKYAGSVLVNINDSGDTWRLPDLRSWIKILRSPDSLPVVSCSGDAENIDHCMLVLDSANGCYLHRQWSFERSIERALKSRAKSVLPLPELPENYLHSLVSYFPDAKTHPQTDHQQLAVLAALRHKLLVLTGGPGTGKTTVAAAILATRLEQNPELRIILTAPTAKAAVRLRESLQKNIPALNCSEDIKNILGSLESSTVDKALGAIRNSHEYRHNANSPLDCDLLLIDECSMVSQKLMARVLEALPEHASLILLGDRQQLASVEAGSVMADICSAAEANVVDSETAGVFTSQTAWQVKSFSAKRGLPPLSGCLIELTENHRFAHSSPLLGTVAGVIRNLSAEDDFSAVAVKIMNMHGDEFEFFGNDRSSLRDFLAGKLAEKRLPSGESMLDLKKLALSGSAEDRQKAFQLLDKLKILAPQYKGFFGIENLNNICMELLKINDIHSAGMAILVRHNDYRIGLFNGDIGLICKNQDGVLQAFFPDRNEGVNIAELPEHEAVFAMSVHKSQGSGFSEVIFVMPEYSSQLMTREMVYTAMTRAENKLCCIGNEDVFADALSKVTERMSNLSRCLKKN